MSEACDECGVDTVALLAERDRLTKENDCLRAMVSKIMPCHYCGVSEIIKCPHGFPGCALMDDLMVGDECINREYRKLLSKWQAITGPAQSAADWLCEAHKGSDQWERGTALRKALK